MDLIPRICISCLLLHLSIGSPGSSAEEVKTGLDVLITENASLLENKKIGVIANHSSKTSGGEWIVEALTEIEGLGIEILYTPEHGLDLLDGEARKKMENLIRVDLHGVSRRPDPSSLRDLYAIVYDIQDTGCRFYTYISTMLLAMDACSEAGIRFIVLDRPNPLGGVTVEGPLLESEQTSFVGMYPIPVRYGLTPGELALMANGEGYLPSGNRAELIVVEMKNWKRSMYYDDTGLPWIPPSPNIPDLESAFLYPGMCLLEGTTLSEGRGTSIPFKLIGAPWLPTARLLETCLSEPPPGIAVSETTYTPVSIPGKCDDPKFEGSAVRGLRMRVTCREAVRSFDFAVSLLYTVKKMEPAKLEWIGDFYIDRLAGTEKLRKVLDENGDLSSLLEKWERESAEFRKKSQTYHIYGDK